MSTDYFVRWFWKEAENKVVQFVFLQTGGQLNNDQNCWLNSSVKTKSTGRQTVGSLGKPESTQPMSKPRT